MATITVTFEAPPVTTHTIQVINTDGTVSPSGQVSVNNGANQSFNITAPTGKHIDEVYADGTSVTNTSSFVTSDNVHGSYTFYNVTGNHTFFVTYAVDDTPGGDAVTDFVESSVSIAPNPATDRILISSPKPIETLEIFDLSGRRVLLAQPNESSVEQTVASLESGVYFVKMLTGGETVMRKFVKR